MPSSYVLVISLPAASDMRIGTLGKIRFENGYYCYVGSASAKKGSMTLEKRTQRHLRTASGKNVVLKWHIDYLLSDPSSSIVSLWKFPSASECDISKRLEGIAEYTVKSFGSSDCTSGCIGHLHYFKKRPPELRKGK